MHEDRELTAVDNDPAYYSHDCRNGKERNRASEDRSADKSQLNEGESIIIYETGRSAAMIPVGRSSTFM
jgi:GH25 family lysozyme M1 (1,4-beta-N-acetylmuramidase)